MLTPEEREHWRNERNRERRKLAAKYLRFVRTVDHVPMWDEVFDHIKVGNTINVWILNVSLRYDITEREGRAPGEPALRIRKRPGVGRVV